MRVGFFAGGAIGLALAVILVGAAAFLPPTNNPLRSTQEAVFSGAGASMAGSTTTTQTTSCSGQGGQSCAPAVEPPNAGADAAAKTSTRSETNSSSSSSAGGAAQGQKVPDSLLATMPGQSAGSLLAALSPIFVGLLVAVLVYGASTRRQGSS